MVRVHTEPPSESVDVVTYRYNNQLMYVPLARDYQQALLHARDAFLELQGLPDSRISLSLTFPAASQTREFVGISALAWPKLIVHLKRYQIIDVHAKDVRATIIPIQDREPAPPYPDGGSEPVSGTSSGADKKTSPTPPSVAPALHRIWTWFFQKLRR